MAVIHVGIYTRMMTMHRMKNNERIDNMMNKITFTEAKILLGYKKKHLLEKLFCNHYLYDIDNLNVKIIAKIK